MPFRNNIIFILAAFLMVSCAELKFVPEDRCLLNKVDVQSYEQTDHVNTGLLKSYVRQNANSRWFSAFRVPLGLYSLAGRDSSRWVNRILKSMGEAPVVFDSVFTAQTCDNLCKELQNEGFLRSKVKAHVVRKKRKVNVCYQLYPGAAYRIRGIDYEIQDSAIAQLLCLDDTENRGLKSGQLFEVAALDNERKRITDLLANHGYYKFHKDYITYRADTVPGSPDVDLVFVLHKYVNRQSGVTAHPCYRVRRVAYASGEATDSVIHLRPSVLRMNTSIRPGYPYSARELRDTYNRFGRLQAVKYTNISFTEVDGKQLLDCGILISTQKPSTISFQPEGTNTAGDFGAAVSLTYQNRNLFRGAEVLSMELRGAFEAVKGLEDYANDNFEEYSAETRLLFPRFIVPFLSADFRRRVNATSEVSMLYDLQNRPEYHRRVLSVAWRYRWYDASHHDRYNVDVLQLNYVFMPWISAKFRRDYLEDNTNRNAILRYNYEDLFIMRSGFGFNYNNGDYAVKANVETAGNLLALCSSLFTMPVNELGQKKLFNIAFAQYVKFDLQYTHNFRIDYNNTLVFHVGMGVAYPYGNSTILPFEKRYFSGGANSVRGWSVRGLGPGKFRGKDGNIDFINQTGDMKIDVNLEYRAHLFWKLGGALFVDAGNVWTLRDYADQPGGQFSLGTFLAQLAVGYGLGFRFNFDYFILRFDLGMKAINPAYEETDLHYPILHPRLSRDFTFHFAVGLPF